MQYKVTSPIQIKAEIGLPSSKSISNRVLVINALAGGGGTVGNVADCDDTMVMLRSLAAQKATPAGTTTDVHGAGTAMRFLTAYYSLTPCGQTMTGSLRMLSRPINVLVDALRSLGAKIDYLGTEGCPPLRISGSEMHGGVVELPANVSSQYISALLMIAPRLKGGLRLVLTGGIASRPYIDMTLALMTDFGAKALWTGQNEITVSEGAYTPRDFTVESDWSAASYWYEIVALAPDAGARVTLKGLGRDSLQGDARVAEYFTHLGVSTRFTPDGVVLEKAAPASSGVLDINLHGEPDLAQTLVVACVMAGRQFKFGGLANLRIKETDRLAALTNEMRKLGYVLRADDEGNISWDGERCERDEQAVIATYDDHRMAMCFAPACLITGGIAIDEPAVVAKSYPRYWDNLAQAGFEIEQND